MTESNEKNYKQKKLIKQIINKNRRQIVNINDPECFNLNKGIEGRGRKGGESRL